MADVQDRLTRVEIEAFATALDFVREYAIRIVSIEPGEVTIELPFDKRFSGPPGQFPASIVGTAGDVAAAERPGRRRPRRRVRDGPAGDHRGRRTLALSPS